MTRRTMKSDLAALPAKDPDPFAGCCWPGCAALPFNGELFCPAHRDQVPKKIKAAMWGAVVEGSLETWRKAMGELRLLAAASAHG